VNLAGVGYVSKYVAKDLGDTGKEGRRPRIRASRNPTYGAVVLERSEDIIEALRKRKVDVGEVHRINLLNILKYAERKSDPWKDLANLVQMNGRLLHRSELTGRMTSVDRTTGEMEE